MVVTAKKEQICIKYRRVNTSYNKRRLQAPTVDVAYSGLGMIGRHQTNEYFDYYNLLHNKKMGLKAKIKAMFRA
jgi:hypothetical protein